MLLEVFSECLEALISHVLISEEVYAGKSAQVKTSRKAEQYPGGSVSGSCTGGDATYSSTRFLVAVILSLFHSFVFFFTFVRDTAAEAVTQT